VARCLLEFRVDERDSWLLKAALVYGAGMANNWAMTGFFPIFLVSLVWLKGVAFFDVRFLGRMFLLGLAGALFYLLLPLVNSLSRTFEFSFWQTLKFELTMQKSYLAGLVYNKYALFKSDRPFWVLALPSLLPALAVAIRWPSYFGDSSRLGSALATWIFHGFYAVLLGLCTWVAWDPQFSPRNYHDGLLSSGILMLPLYYLGALCAGYFSGYFLLVFGTKPQSRSRQSYTRWKLLNLAVTCLIWLLPLVAAGMLLYRNLPCIRLTNGPMLRQYASLTQQGLPPKGVLLSDDPHRLLLMESALTQNGSSKNYLYVSTSWLTWPDYHRVLKRRYPQTWPSDPPKERKPFDAGSLIQILAQLARSNQVYYLHPSFGYYFEVFYPEPHGLAYKLAFYPTNSVMPPPPPQAVVLENQAFWTQADEATLNRLVAAVAPPPPQWKPGPMDRLMTRIHLKKEINRDALALAPLYSRALDFWSVELQRMGLLSEAAAHLKRALELNPDNRVAQANLEANFKLQAGERIPSLDARTIEEQFGKYRSWEQMMNDNGPFDEPNFCYPQGLLFARGRLYRQAAQQFARVKALAPDNLPARLFLAQLFILGRMPDEALKVVNEIRNQPDMLTATNQPDVLAVEVAAHLTRKDVPSAEAVVQLALGKDPNNRRLLATAAQTYMNFGCYSNALFIIDRQLKLNPEDPNALVNQGLAFLRISAFDKAVEPLTRVLTSETNNFSQLHYSALLDRAIAYLRSDKLDAAQEDYETLQKAFPAAYQLYYGLGEVAYRKKDTNAAVLNYQLYLANAPTNTPEASFVSKRVKDLTPSRP
jgi:tetratricopeptide (TPR) repeat protein